jgi:hypothetical protein
MAPAVSVFRSWCRRHQAQLCSVKGKVTFGVLPSYFSDCLQMIALCAGKSFSYSQNIHSIFLPFFISLFPLFSLSLSLSLCVFVVVVSIPISSVIFRHPSCYATLCSGQLIYGTHNFHFSRLYLFLIMLSILYILHRLFNY